MAVLLGTCCVPGARAHGIACPPFPDEVCKAQRGGVTSPRPNHWEVALLGSAPGLSELRPEPELTTGCLGAPWMSGIGQNEPTGGEQPKAATPTLSECPRLLCSPQLPTLVLSWAQEIFPNKLVSQ